VSTITVCGLTGLAFLSRNVIKAVNFYKPTNFTSANSGQVRVKTIVL